MKVTDYRNCELAELVSYQPIDKNALPNIVPTGDVVIAQPGDRFNLSPDEVGDGVRGIRTAETTTHAGFNWIGWVIFGALANNHREVVCVMNVTHVRRAVQ